MDLWRVSPETNLAKAAHSNSAGRWSWASRDVLYTSCTPELAALEALAHKDGEDGGYWLCRVWLPDACSVRRANKLPDNWTRMKPWTRAYGNRWFDSGRSACLEVPSALCPESSNMLVNPLHRDARGLHMKAVRRFNFDSRLLRC